MKEAITGVAAVIGLLAICVFYCSTTYVVLVYDYKPLYMVLQDFFVCFFNYISIIVKITP